MSKNVIRRFIQVLLTLCIQASLLFIAAGTLAWKWAWIFLFLAVINLVINLTVLPVEVIEERGRAKKDAKKWDKIITSMNIAPLVLMYVFCGLDYRYGWTGDVTIPIHVMGLILTFAGSLLFTWAMVSNRFFSTLVRLQIDRGHKVVTQGPYKYVRHPGYVGFIVMSLSTPIALGTMYGLFFSGITALLLIIRTGLEDKTLKKELEGYSEYSGEVKHRLVPLIW